MKCLILAATIVVGTIAGCQNQQEAKIEAYKRWQHSRAQVVNAIGVDQLKAGQLDRAGTKAHEALALDDDYTDARLLLSKVYIEQGRYSAAITELEKVCAKSPNSYDAHYLLGVAKEKDGQLEAALDDYRKAQAINGTSIDAVMAAAEVLVTLGRIDEAGDYVESYVDKAGDEPGMFELAGKIAMMRQNFTAAARYYQQACDFAPKNHRYAEELARSQFLCRDYAEAAATIKNLRLSKDYAPQPWLLAMLGDCCLATGKTADARDAFLAAGEIDPSSALVWANVAKAALALGDVPRAVLSARRALSIDSECLEAQLLLGYALLRNSQAVQALAVLKQTVAAHPDNGMALCLLGRAHAAAGDAPKARQCYGDALRHEPGNELAKELLADAGR